MSEESAKVFEGFIKQFAQELGQGPSFIDTEFMNKILDLEYCEEVKKFVEK